MSARSSLGAHQSEGARRAALDPIWRWLTEPADSIQGLERRRRARLLSLLLAPILAVGVLVMVWRWLIDPSYTPSLVGMGGVVVVAIAYGLSRTRYHATAAVLAVAVFPVVIFGLLIMDYTSVHFLSVLAFLPINVVLASILFSVRSAAVVGALDCVGILVLPAVIPEMDFPAIIFPLGYTAMLSTLVVMSAHQRDLLEMDRRKELAALYRQGRAALERLQAVLNSTDDGMMLLDAKGLLLVANPKAQELLGFSVQDHLGKHFLRIVLEREKQGGQLGMGYTRDALREMVRRVSAQPEAVFRRSFRVEWPEHRALEEIGTPVWSEDGRVTGRLLVLHDMTDREATERYREDVTHMIVHDLRGPLAGIIAGLHLAKDILKEEEPNLVDLGVTLDVPYNNAETMLRLVGMLLDVHRLELGEVPLDVTPVRLDEVARQARATLQGVAEEASIEVTVSAPEGLEPLAADEEKVRRVVTNLLDNALRHTPENGQVRIEIRGGEEVQQVSVIDTGAGVPEEDREWIFEHFARGSDRGRQRGSKGWGLGLAFCKLVVEAHGGRIWVGKGQEGGAAFHFTLPVAGPVRGVGGTSAVDRSDVGE